MEITPSERTGIKPINSWTDTKKINRYTGLPNKVFWFNSKEHSTVYKRRGGWSFTSRIPLDNKWIQESLGSHYYLASEDEAMLMSVNSMLDLKKRLRE